MERALDAFESTHRDVAVTRMRPAFVFQPSAASEQRRIFAGRLLPTRLALGAASLALPLPNGLMLQAVHADDVGAAFISAIRQRAHGAFNLAADDVLDGPALQEVFGGRPIRVPAGVARLAVSAGFRSRLLPADPRLLDALLRVPMLSNVRAREALGWIPGTLRRPHCRVCSRDCSIARVLRPHRCTPTPDPSTDCPTASR